MLIRFNTSLQVLLQSIPFESLHQNKKSIYVGNFRVNLLKYISAVCVEREDIYYFRTNKSVYIYVSQGKTNFSISGIVFERTDYM